jgi:hypothetical protein
MPTNYSIPNVTGFQEMGLWANSVTNNVFGIGIMIVVLIMVFTTLHRFYGVRLSVGGTSVIGGILASIWRMTGLINDFVMFTIIMLCAVGILYMYLSKEE